MDELTVGATGESARRLPARLLCNFELSKPLGVRSAEFLRLGRVVLVFFQAETVRMKQLGLFLFQISRRLFDAKLLIVLAAAESPKRHADAERYKES